MENTAENLVSQQSPQLENKVRLNLGCGHAILEGWINVDKYNPRAEVKADILKLPFAANSADEILMSHVIEHLPWRKHIDIFESLHRILKMGGKLTLAYPEFEKCALNFINNKGGKKWSWWIQTLYGMQTDAGQFHVSPIVSEHLKDQLTEVGFTSFELVEDESDSCLTCIKCNPLPWY